MRTALFHHALDSIGGAELVTFALARAYHADIYTTNIDRKKIAEMGFADVIPRIHSIGTLTAKAPFRQEIALWKFRHLNLSGRYDRFIISSDWAIGGAVKNHPNLWYVHGPLDELWELKDHVRKKMLAWWMPPIFDAWTLVNRHLIKRCVAHVDRWACNAENTKRRIAKIFSKEAIVVHPPTETGSYRYEDPKGYWLSVNRLTSHKRIELQLDAFRSLPEERLIIVGDYEKGARQFESYKKELEGLRPKNAEFRYWVSDEELKKLYAGCIGFVTTAEREDFGMTAVEAMAAGKPVIAPDDGGYRESVVQGKTGILLHEMNMERLAEAVKTIDLELQNDPLRYRDACRARAKEFDTSIFIKKMNSLLS
ncbi:glycosyltransferase [Patescibacteria group bacterium]|nr:glycosyltransferase [Patescibacteria group bacterium]MCL5114897.1 glycosyltransferase [Patescibacteria group bacterium]